MSPYAVIDVGSNTIHLLVGEAEKGTVLPVTGEKETVHEAVLETLPEWNLPEETVAVAIGGSARAIARLTRHPLTRKHLKKLAAKISKESSAVLAREEGLAPERARVLPAAITTFAAVLEHFGRPTLVVAHGGIREGAVLMMADEATSRRT